MAEKTIGFQSGNSLLSFECPFFEHDFTVIKFHDEGDDHDDI